MQLTTQQRKASGVKHKIEELTYQKSNVACALFYAWARGLHVEWIDCFGGQDFDMLERLSLLESRPVEFNPLSFERRLTPKGLLILTKLHDLMTTELGW
jgi:hypothetical protein